MSYTPSMDELREAWLTAEYEERGHGTSDDDLRAEFDRALAVHDVEVRASVVPEVGMPCASTKPHAAHAWQMSATGWCLCAGVVAEEPEWVVPQRSCPCCAGATVCTGPSPVGLCEPCGAAWMEGRCEHECAGRAVRDAQGKQGAAAKLEGADR